MHIAAWGGWGEGEADELPRFVSDYLADDTNHVVRKLKKQLSESNCDRREPFLFVGVEHIESWSLIYGEEGVLPLVPPTLPSPIDAIWLAGVSGRSRVLSWYPGGGWVERPKPN